MSQIATSTISLSKTMENNLTKIQTQILDVYLDRAIDLANGFNFENNEIKDKFLTVFKEFKNTINKKSKTKKTKKSKKEQKEPTSLEEIKEATELNVYNCKQLKALLEEAKLSQRGKKNDLVQRYFTYLTKPDSLTEEDKKLKGKRGRPSKKKKNKIEEEEE